MLVHTITGRGLLYSLPSLIFRSEVIVPDFCKQPSENPRDRLMCGYPGPHGRSARADPLNPDGPLIYRAGPPESPHIPPPLMFRCVFSPAHPLLRFLFFFFISFSSSFFFYYYYYYFCVRPFTIAIWLLFSKPTLSRHLKPVYSDELLMMHSSVVFTGQ